MVACSCRAPRPTCSYLESDIAFLGRVSFTNDDGSGTFVQDTLVRFDVEEIFQGLSTGTRQVWIDPGSFTSCYEEYQLGRRYLVFGSKSARMPSGTAAMSAARRRVEKKPAPPGFDLVHPPTVYLASECNGSRPADYPTIERDIYMLRAARARQQLPRVLGYIYLTPFRGWPFLNGPGLAGATVTIENESTKLTATSKADGSFSLSDAPAGIYKVRAQLPPLVGYEWPAMLIVPEHGCGSADVALTTTSVIRGTVLDSHGQPAGGIPVVVSDAATPEEQAASIDDQTSTDGVFSIMGVPNTDVYLSAGPQTPSTKLPYRRIYYANVLSRNDSLRLRLKPGERRTGITLWLGAPLQARSLKVRVTRPDGTPVAKANVFGSVSGDTQEYARTAADGNAVLPCLDGISYQISARLPIARVGPRMAETPAPAIDCVSGTEPVHLIVGKTPVGR